MPSSLPVIKANTSQENVMKMKFIARHNKRSLASELVLVVEEHIQEFEREYGKIRLY